MIYTKKANFPYPVLMNFSDDYTGSEFELDVMLRENIESYIIDVSWKISSVFIQNLIKSGKARLLLIIKSKDNQFFPLEFVKRPQIILPKSKLSISSRTVMQLMVQAKDDVSFAENSDLNDFYNSVKEEIIVKSGNVLAFSNTVIFDGSQKKPLDLFEKKIDSSIKCDIETRIGEETILIVYKSEELQFSDMVYSRELNYPYLYNGLQKALMFFIDHYADNAEEGVIISEMEPPENELDAKLYRLMQAKKVDELTRDNIDEVVYLISDRLLSRYKDAVRGMRNAD